MMDIYRAVLQPHGAHIFNWGSDALFGSLCWAINDTLGEKELEGFLDNCRSGKPPVVFSNGFPGDLLPRPCSNTPPRIEKAIKADLIKRSFQRKKIKSINYLSQEEFKKLLFGTPPVFDGSERRPEFKLHVSYHNTIDRCTGATLQSGGGLYSTEEFYVEKSGTVAIYILLDAGWENKAAHLLQIVGMRGVGARKSSGRGGFRVIDFSRFNNWPEIPEADGFITLSNYVPAPADPVDGLYRISVKFGRLDRELSIGAPFKRPLVQLLPGAVFRLQPGEKVRQFYGCLVEKIAPAFPKAVQGCFAFAVPCKTSGLYLT